jgi:hypothetical protein
MSATDRPQRKEDRHPPRPSDAACDCAVLDYMLLSPWPWTLEELGREVGDHTEAIDAVARLTGAGLVHRLDRFVFPTRVARRAEELRIGTV